MSEVQESGNGRKKTFEPNLVPFIDLMSVLITFLLITAVWTQVSMMQIGTSLYSKKNPDQQPPPPPKDADVVLKIDVKASGYTIFLGKQVINLPLIAGEFDDEGLKAQMERAKQLHPEKTDGAIAVADELPYEKLIKGMDIMLNAGFSAISVLTGAPK